MPKEKYPVGTVVPFGGGTVPAGYLLCDGTAVSRTGRADLFAVIGTDFGGGDGSTTFNLPDARQRLGMGSTAIASGATGGALSHTHSTASHPHTATQPADHGQHAEAGGHTHDAHTTASRTTGAAQRIDGPATHATDGQHQHDAHSAHSGFAITDGGSGTTGTANPPVLSMDFIIASFNTHLVSFDIRSDHFIADSLRARIAHSVRQDHVVTQGGKSVTKKAFDVRSDHLVDFDELLTLTRSFSIRQDHVVADSLRVRIQHGVRQDHVVAFSRSLDAARAFAVRQDHMVTDSLRARVAHSIRSDHVVAIDRGLVLFRDFSTRQDHVLSVTTVKIFVRSFSTRQNHHLSARICLDWEDLPAPGDGGTTIIKRLFIFDD